MNKLELINIIKEELKTLLTETRGGHSSPLEKLHQDLLKMAKSSKNEIEKERILAKHAKRKLTNLFPYLQGVIDENVNLWVFGYIDPSLSVSYPFQPMNAKFFEGSTGIRSQVKKLISKYLKQVPFVAKKFLPDNYEQACYNAGNATVTYVKETLLGQNVKDSPWLEGQHPSVFIAGLFMHEFFKHVNEGLQKSQNEIGRLGIYLTWDDGKEYMEAAIKLISSKPKFDDVKEVKSLLNEASSHAQKEASDLAYTKALLEMYRFYGAIGN